MADDRKVKVEITGDAQSLMKELGKAGESIRDFHGQAQASAVGIGASFDGLTKGLQGGVLGVVTAVAAVVGAVAIGFGNLAKRGFETAGALQDMSDKSSLSIEFLSVMKVAAGDANVPL